MKTRSNHIVSSVISTS